MINKLINRKKLARVSSAPGKTASVNFYRCAGFRLVDLPGYGFARVSKEEKAKWAELVEGYLMQNRRIRLVIQLVDSRHPISQDDIDMIDYLSSYEIPFLIAATKFDKLNKSELAARKSALPVETGLPEEQILLFSSETGAGVLELQKLIMESVDAAEPEHLENHFDI